MGGDMRQPSRPYRFCAGLAGGACLGHLANAKRYHLGRRLTRVMPSFTRLDLMVCPRLREASLLAHLRRDFQRTSGIDQNRDRRAREALDRSPTHG